MLCYIILCYIILYYIILHYIILYYIILYYIILYYIILYYIILYYISFSKVSVSVTKFILGTSKLSTVTVTPAVTNDFSTHTTPASQWPTPGNVEYCLIAKSYIYFFLAVWYWIDLTLWAIAPFFTIIVSNSAIIVRLARSNELKGGVKQPRRHYRSRSPPSPGRSVTSSMSSSSSVLASRSSAITGRSRRVSSSTTMLLVVSVAFLVSNFPMAVCMLNYETWLNQAESLRDIARIRLFQGACSFSLHLSTYMSIMCSLNNVYHV